MNSLNKSRLPISIVHNGELSPILDQQLKTADVVQQFLKSRFRTHAVFIVSVYIEPSGNFVS